MDGGACFDSTGAYRYRLWREWDAALPSVTFVMLNPSTADAERDDPTIRRCVRFARGWGFGRLNVVNLSAYRTASPEALFAAGAPCGSANAAHLLAATETAALVVAAWGTYGRQLTHPPFEVRLHHLGLTKLGQPRHPLYVRSDARPVAWTSHQITGRTS